jgi:hypothetical protein
MRERTFIHCKALQPSLISPRLEPTYVDPFQWHINKLAYHCQAVTNTLAYSTTVTVPTKKSFIFQAHDETCKF